MQPYGDKGNAYRSPGYSSPAQSGSAYSSPISEHPSAVPYGDNQGAGQPGGIDPNYQLPPNVTLDTLAIADGDNDSSLPSAPPLNTMDTINGYGHITFDDASLAPPSYDAAVRQVQPENRPPVHVTPVIYENEARDALLEFCQKKCCYGSGAAKAMTIANMAATSAFHYVLESFGESRSTAWTFASYKGEPLDTPMNGPAPLPWNIQLFASQKFQNETQKLEVPHTASVKLCHKCHGIGRQRCFHCTGRGRSHCTCHSGYTTMGGERRMCGFCHGTGYRVCISCHGHGHVRCNLCLGCCQLKWFIQLTVVWTNHLDDFILERSEMPDELIRNASGDTAFEEEMPWVFPVNHCPEASINRASEQLVTKHRMQFTNERVLLQRHRLRIVPVTEVSALWKEKAFTFFVYGLERKVYTSNYPQSCCCGCALL